MNWIILFLRRTLAKSALHRTSRWPLFIWTRNSKLFFYNKFMPHSQKSTTLYYPDLNKSISYLPQRPKHVEWPCRNKTCTVLHQGVHLISLKTNFTVTVNRLNKQMHCLWCQSPNRTHTKKIFLALQSCLQVSKCKVCKAKVAVGSSHVHLVLQIFSKCQILVVVTHCLSEVPQTVMRVTQKVACLWFALNIMQLLLDTQKCPSCNTWTLRAAVKTTLFTVTWCQCFVVQSSQIQIYTSSWYNQLI